MSERVIAIHGMRLQRYRGQGGRDIAFLLESHESVHAATLVHDDRERSRPEHRVRDYRAQSHERLLLFPSLHLLRNEYTALRRNGSELLVLPGMQVAVLSGQGRPLAEQDIEHHQLRARRLELTKQPCMETAWPARRHRWDAHVRGGARADLKAFAAIKALAVARQREAVCRLLVDQYEHDVRGWIDGPAQLKQPAQADLLLRRAHCWNGKERGANCTDPDAGQDRKPPRFHDARGSCRIAPPGAISPVVSGG